MAETDAVAVGIWSPFRSLLTAQALSAALGLVFWVIVARLVEAHDVGVAAAAISLQTLLGIVTVLGCSTMLVSELPKATPTRQRTLVLRSLLVVFVSSAIGAGLVVAVSPLLPSNLEQALGNPIGAVTFVLGTAAFAWALVVDDACLGVKRSGLQVWRNLVASSLRFPATAVLLLLGFTDAHVLQVCWVLPLLASIPFTLWRLRLPRPDRTSPPLLADIRGFIGLALRNHALSLSLAAASQTVPVIAALTLSSVDNAEFAIAWLLATFVFLPPYLLSTALFAHGANVSEEEFRRSMERTIPAALSLSALLCVGAWVLGEPVLLIFGGDYSRHSWAILALLVPAGLWMVIKDHLVALWRTQRQFALATRLAVAALVIEVVGAMAGGIIGGARGLCIGWLIAMGVEMVLGLPWLRRAFGGLHWRWPLPLRRRTELGRVGVQVVVGAALVAGHRRRRDLDRHPGRDGYQRQPHGQRAARAGSAGADVRADCRLRRSQDRPQRAVRHRRPGASDPDLRRGPRARRAGPGRRRPGDLDLHVVPHHAAGRGTSRSGSATSTEPSARPARPGSRCGSSSSGCRTGRSTTRRTAGRHRAARPSCRNGGTSSPG